ncbi:MAG: hypothetical protein HY042_01275, partial [Spirochaetia bacterium]|nr:hypothetical protein [Spirochaetia bacterium]
MGHAHKRAWVRRIFGFVLVAFVGLNVAAAWALHELPALRYLDTDIFVWTWKHDTLVSGRLSGFDCLLLGDSQIMGGVLPRLLSEKTGQRCYNLGLPAMKVRGLPAQLSLITKHAPSVRTVIVNVSPIFLFRGDVERAFHTYSGADLSVRVFPRFQSQLGAVRSAGDGLNTLFLRLP